MEEKTGVEDRNLRYVAELAELLGVSETAVRKWALPVVKREGRLVYHDLAVAVKRRLSNLEAQLRENQEGLTDSRIRLNRAKLEAQILRNETSKGKLIPDWLLQEVWNDLSIKIISTIHSLTTRAARAVCARLGIEDQIAVEEAIREQANYAVEVIGDYDVEDFRRRSDLEVVEPEIRPDDEQESTES